MKFYELEEKVRPLNDDVLLVARSRKDIEPRSSIIVQQNLADQTEQFFQVLAVGPKVQDVRVNDIVFLSWKRITPPVYMRFKGGFEAQVGQTSEKEILCIIEPTE